MAINALIAQGITPLGEGVPQTLMAVNQMQQQQHRNALMDQQASQQNQLFQQGQQENDAKKAFAEAQFLSQSQDPVRDVQNFPHILQAFHQHGIDPSTLTPEAIRSTATQAMQRASAMLGQGPQVPTVRTLKADESLVSTDPRTGATKPLYTAPDKPEEFTGQPQAMMLNGKPVMAIRGSKGTVKPIDGASPYTPPEKAPKPQPGYGPDGQIAPRYDKQVQAILGYRAPPLPSGRNGPSAAIMAEVYARDPTYDASQFPAKSAALKSFLSGKDAAPFDQVNASIQHLSLLKDLAEGLKSGDIQVINQAKQAWQRATGSAAPTKAETVANIAAAEINKIATGSPGAEADRDLTRAALAIKQSPEQLSGNADAAIGLMAGRLHGIVNRARVARIGDTVERLLLPETKAALDAHGFAGSDSSAETPPAPAEVTATGPNGQKIVLRNGQWVPLGR